MVFPDLAAIERISFASFKFLFILIFRIGELLIYYVNDLYLLFVILYFSFSISPIHQLSN